ncbi:Glucose dehydrogenase [FAD, quinone] [Armadillidium vulgare]|nr:Glucose dehydrogenase [FAD, quinone] [Armadillidium vulgare]
MRSNLKSFNCTRRSRRVGHSLRQNTRIRLTIGLTWNFILFLALRLLMEGSKYGRFMGLMIRHGKECLRNCHSKTRGPFYPMILRPESRGHIKLRSTNPFLYPYITTNYLTDPRDAAVLVEGIKIAVSLVETKAFKKFGSKFYEKHIPGCESHQMYTDGYWECLARHYTATIYHPVGTCKMGPYWDQGAVVDPELK